VGYLRKFTKSGELLNSSRPAGQGVKSLTADPAGNIYGINQNDGSQVIKFAPDGTYDVLGSTGGYSQNLVFDPISNKIYTTNAGNNTVTAMSSVLAPPVISITSGSETVKAGNLISGYSINSTGGSIKSYSIDPAPDNEVRFDRDSGRIFGRPADLAPTKTYTITATNSAGSSSATFALTVSAPDAPIISSSRTYITSWVGAQTFVAIESTGGPVSSWAVTPDIATPDNGLIFDSGTNYAAFFGYPLHPASAQTYTILASNSSGSSTFTFTLLILSAPQSIPIPAGSTSATVPASPSFPGGITLNFSQTEQDESFTVVPVVNNPVRAIDTPFTFIPGSTKIVEIRLPPYHWLGPETTVCLSGAETDHLYQLGYSAWEEVPSRSYVNGRVCGLTNDVGIFALASLPTLAAPAFTLTSASETATVGSAIAGYTISSTGGAIASYSISPTIGNGLSFSTVTGLISGTPTAAAAAVTYTITGTNATSSSTATYRITVNASLAAPAFTLSRASETATVGSAIAGYTISSTGGAIASYSISPAIGNGLSFSTTTGLISGRPIAAAAAVTYTITGINATSSSTATYQITINAGAAPTVALVEIPDPIQQSKIAALSVSSAVAGTPSPIVISGSFIEKISAIQINGAPLAAGSWSQTATSVSFTMPAKSAGIYEIQLYNGAVPVLKSQSFTFTAPVVVIAPTPMPTPTVKIQSSIIKCVKDSRVRRIRGINPTCPDGYVKK
jgi:hypothetical protein